MKMWQAGVVALFCGGAVLAAAPPPTMKVMLTPSAQRAARYQAYLSVSRMLDSKRTEAALSKLSALEKQDSQNALPLYLKAYAQLLNGESDKALVTMGAGNRRPYLINYLDARGQPYDALYPQLQHLRALVRGLGSYAAGLAVRERIQALRTLSEMASKTLTGRPFTIIAALVGKALHGMVDKQLGPACSAAGDAKGAAAVQDRQSRLQRLGVMLKEGMQRLAPLHEVGPGLAQARGRMHEFQVAAAVREEKTVRDALRQTGFLQP